MGHIIFIVIVASFILLGIGSAIRGKVEDGYRYEYFKLDEEHAVLMDRYEELVSRNRDLAEQLNHEKFRRVDAEDKLNNRKDYSKEVIDLARIIQKLKEERRELSKQVEELELENSIKETIIDLNNNNMNYIRREDCYIDELKDKISEQQEHINTLTKSCNSIENKYIDLRAKLKKRLGIRWK